MSPIIPAIQALYSVSAHLSLREFECLKLCAHGLTMQEIVERFLLSPRTVETYLERIKNKLGVDKKSELGRIFQSNFSL